MEKGGRSVEPRISILIATLGRRGEKFKRLMGRLIPQFIHNAGQIEVIAYWNNGELPIGDIRNALLEEAKGEYVCFIDDDDMVPDYYFAEIIRALGKDYVGFQVELFNNETLKPPVYHSIRYNIWHEDEKGYYRGVTHLNPIRREIALQGKFGKMDGGEDVDWARQVLPLVRSENYIDKIMYYYYHDSHDTSFGGEYKEKNIKYYRAVIDDPHFRWHPDSKEVAEGNLWRSQ